MTLYFEYYIMLFVSYSGFVTFSHFDPPSGSVLPGFEGIINFTSLNCLIASGDMNRTVVWSIKFNNSKVSQQIDYSKEEFLIYNSLQTKLIVQNLTANLDGAVLYCGTEQEPELGNFTLRIFREHQCVLVYRVSMLFFSSFLISESPYFKNKLIKKNAAENERNVAIDFGLTPVLFPVSSKVTLEKEGQTVSLLEKSNNIFMINGSILFFKLMTRNSAGQYTLTTTYYHQENVSQEVGTSVAKLTLNVTCK